MAGTITDLIADLNKIQHNVEKAKTETIMKIMSDRTREVKRRTPVDTGDLRDDWHTDIGYNYGDLLNTMDYFEHVEFGHKTRGGNSFVPGVFMLKDTYELIKSNMDFYQRYFWEKING